ncbi:MAG: glycoside hydrolase family 16 protein [Bacteroidetes bacterium]|nr:glycoside hydrolase family 16 protein [Bacteroidota bacterium]
MMRLASFTVIFVLCVLFTGCNSYKQLAVAENLVWSDEFDSGSKPNTTYWDYELGYQRNNELQTYTDDFKNVRLEDGYLVLEAHRGQTSKAKRGKSVNTTYTSGSITTQNRLQWQYGYFEFRMKFPQGKGLWPAVWMINDLYHTAAHKDKGEIDIVEYVGYNENRVIHAIHVGTVGHRSYATRVGQSKISKPHTDFHLFGLLWTPKKLIFLQDGKRVFVVLKKDLKKKSSWPFDQPFHLKINLAVGGSLGGKEGVNADIFPQKMLIDYIRVYQKP